MPWKEPGKGDKDPWNSGSQQPPDLDDVLESPVRDEHHTGAASLEQRVGRDRRSVQEGEVGPLPEDPSDPVQHGLRRVGGGRRNLEGADLTTVEKHQVGEGASGIDGEEWR